MDSLHDNYTLDNGEYIEVTGYLKNNKYAYFDILTFIVGNNEYEIFYGYYQYNINLSEYLGYVVKLRAYLII